MYIYIYIYTYVHIHIRVYILDVSTIDLITMWPCGETGIEVDLK